MSTPVLTYQAHIAAGLACEFTYDGASEVNCLWSCGEKPELRGQALRNYRGARARFVERVAALRGASVLIVSLDAGVTSCAVITPPRAGRA